MRENSCTCFTVFENFQYGQKRTGWNTISFNSIINFISNLSTNIYVSHFVCIDKFERTIMFRYVSIETAVHSTTVKLTSLPTNVETNKIVGTCILEQ